MSARSAIMLDFENILLLPWIEQTAISSIYFKTTEYIFLQSQNVMAHYHMIWHLRQNMFRSATDLFHFWQLTSHFPLTLLSQFHVLHFFAFQMILNFVFLS